MPSIPPVPDLSLPKLNPGERRIRMVDRDIWVAGRRMHYSISDNTEAEVYALNVHGFFAGGGVYWRESTRLAARLGMRVVNPNMPGFAGSEGLHWDDLTMHNFTATLIDLLDHLGVDKALLVGHSMGAAVSVQFAHDFPERTVGLVYRDGVATSSWKNRTGIFKRIVSVVSPDLGDILDIGLSMTRDVPDLLMSRLMAMVSTAAPDIRENTRNLLETAPVAAMLLFTDQTPLVERLGRRPELPVLTMWGRFDRLVPRRTADEFAEIIDRPVHWVWGGHSWMVPRPATSIQFLLGTSEGRAFLEEVSRGSGWRIPAESLAG